MRIRRVPYKTKSWVLNLQRRAYFPNDGNGLYSVFDVFFVVALFSLEGSELIASNLT